jgi:hypothetical protein
VKRRSAQGALRALLAQGDFLFAVERYGSVVATCGLFGNRLRNLVRELIPA